MRVLGILLGLSGVWAQYKLIGTQIDVQKKTESQFELTLMPEYVRIYSRGYWDTLQADLDFVFTREKIYWLDHRAHIAYEVSLEKGDTTPYPLERLGETEIDGHQVQRVRLRLPDRQIEAYWSTQLSFDWRPWVDRLGNSDMAFLGRMLAEGIPLQTQVYDTSAKLLMTTRIQKVERLSRTETFTPPYPVRRFGE